MNENESAKAAPHEHSKYMPVSESEADSSISAESPNDQKPSYPIAPVRSSDGNCTYHSKSSATHICTKCKTTLCRVCAFIHPSRGSLVFCPKCVSKPLNPYPTDRRNSLIIAYVMAILGTLGAGITFGGILNSTGVSENAVGLIIIVSMLLPSFIGSSFSYGAMDVNRGNGIAVWLALCWNGLILFGITAIIVIGNFVS